MLIVGLCQLLQALVLSQAKSLTPVVKPKSEKRFGLITGVPRPVATCMFSESKKAMDAGKQRQFQWYL